MAIQELGVSDYILTPHAAWEMERRGLIEEQIANILKEPEQVIEIRSDRAIFQSRTAEGGKTYLIRVVLDMLSRPPAIITAYKTSKILKYWRKTP